MVLFVHNRYRTTGGEERTVEDLMWLVREHLHERAELIAPDSKSLSRTRAALALALGGRDPEEVMLATLRGGARVVHAHNLQPALGWRALAAAREGGARVVLHLHQYRLVCAIGVCFTRGAECTRCHGRNTLPGVRLKCRGSAAEAVAYGASLAMWQRRVVRQADRVIVPSVFARERLRDLGAPLAWERVHVLAPPIPALAAAPIARSRDIGASPFALVVSRLSPEKGVDVAIDACRLLGMPLVIAGDGPAEPLLRKRAAAGDVRFAGRVGDAQLAELRARAAIALVPARSPETFGLAAAEAMAAGLAVAASRVGALPELVEDAALAPAGDAGALAQVMARQLEDADAGGRARERVSATCSPEVVAARLAAIYAGEEPRGGRP